MLDIILSAFALIVLAPVFIILIQVSYFFNGSPVFFIQQRVGKNWRKFNIYKFRTMVADAHKLGPGISSKDDLRITKFGKFLRKYKLDELPQLYNVLKGDMSIVGPRPEVPGYAEIYNKDYTEILRVKPGISDFASIHFKDEALLLDSHNAEEIYKTRILPEKIILYKKYIREMNVITDTRIILATFKSLFR